MKRQQFRFAKQVAQAPAPLSLIEFAQQYVLARAATLNDSLGGQYAAREAVRAWTEIEQAAKAQKKETT